MSCVIRRAFGLYVLTCVAAFLTTTASSAAGPCEKIQYFNYGFSYGPLKTCYMDSTVIDSKDFTITSERDETVEAFHADGNKQLKRLPNNLGKKFPSLFQLSAADCSIKEVLKENIKGLSKLQFLFLSGNKIEKIDDDTFEYISAVEIIDLCE